MIDRVILGDCLEEIKKIESNSIDMVLADLPFGVTNEPFDIKIDLSRLWPELLRVRRNKRTPMLFFARFPFNYELYNSNPSMAKIELVWNRIITTDFLNANRKQLQQHGTILVFYEDAPIFNPQKTGGHKRKVSTRRVDSGNYNAAGVSSYDSTERYQTTIYTYSGHIKRESRIHSQQKPVKLLMNLIKTYTNNGDVVLDPTSGSGSTAIACMRTDRHFICIEKDEEFYRMSNEAIIKEMNSYPLLNGGIGAFL